MSLDVHGTDLHDDLRTLATHVVSPPDPSPSAALPPALAFESLALAGQRVLLVGSAGGHLEELLKIADLIGVSPASLVVTNDTPQAATLHETRNVRFVRYVKPRDLTGAVAVYPTFRDLMAEQPWDAVLSTGSAVAVPALLAARRAGIRSIYVESYARFSGSSTTGKLLRFVRDVETYTQHAAWADDRWKHVGSIRAAFPTRGRVPSQQRGDRPMRILVTIGTIRPYRFDSVVDAVLKAMPPDAELVWQLGCTTRSDLPGDVYEVMPHDEFLRAAEKADVVVSHAGVGTAMTLAEMGKPTILVPRRAHRGEHVDDHQVEVCADLAADGIALHVEADELSREHLTSSVYAW